MQCCNIAATTGGWQEQQSSLHDLLGADTSLSLPQPPMLSSVAASRLRLLGLQAGGLLQHACSLLPIADAAAAAGVSAASGSSSSPGVAAAVALCGRSISTTRGIYMGRVFIRENLQKQAAKSSLFTRENFQFLSQNEWSLSACEQVLSNHHSTQHKRRGAQGERRGARGERPPRPAHSAAELVNRQLHENIKATQGLEQLQGVITRHAHQMNGRNFLTAMGHVCELLLKRDGTPDFPAAALLMNQLVELVKPHMTSLSGPELITMLAAMARARFAPSTELLQDMLQQLMADGGKRLEQAYPVNIAHLLLALSKLTNPQGSWPVMVLIRERVREQLQEQLAWSARRQQTLQEQLVLLQQRLDSIAAADSASSAAAAASPPAVEGSASSSGSSSNAAAAGPSSSSGSRSGGNRSSRHSGQQDDDLPSSRPQLLRLMEQTTQNMTAPREAHPLAVKNNNALAMCAYLLDRTNTSSPEYLAELHQWLQQPLSLAGVFPNAVVQLWQALKGHWTKHEGRAAAAAAAATQGASEAPAAEELADDVAAAAAASSAEEQQRRLAAAFGDGTLASLAAASAPLVAHMTERELGQVLNALGRLRFSTPELLAAVSASFKALTAAQTPSLLAQTTAAWAAAQLQAWDPVLVQPALLSAVTQPDALDGFLASRVLVATSQMPPDVRAQQEVLLQAELHRLSGARGPPPSAAQDDAAGGGSAAAVPVWVASLADSLAVRIGECRPREIAYILLAYSEIPGLPVHEALFGAAAAHIELHTHTFTQFRDMEMIATAFERMRYKQGLPALEALQKLTNSMLEGGSGTA